MHKQTIYWFDRRVVRLKYIDVNTDITFKCLKSERFDGTVG